MKFSIKKTIEQIGKEYTQLIIDNIKETYKLSDINEGNIDYFIKKDMEVKSYLRNYVLNEKKQRLLKSMMFMGIIYLMVGVALYATIYVYKERGIYQMPLILILLGGVIIMFSGSLEFFYSFLGVAREKKLATEKFANVMDKYEKMRNMLLPNCNNNLTRANLKKLGIFSNKDILFILNLEMLRAYSKGKKKFSDNDWKRINNILGRINSNL